MLDTQVDLDKRYVSVHYLEREEDGYSLIFVSDTECSYRANRTAAIALGLLRGEATVRQVCARLADEYDLAPDEIRQQAVEYVAELLSRGIVREAEGQEARCGQYKPPSLVPLEDVYEKARQCKIFGMP